MRKRNFIQFNLFPFSEEDADVEWQESWIEKQKGIIIKIKCMKMSNYGVCEVCVIHLFTLLQHTLQITIAV